MGCEQLRQSFQKTGIGFNTGTHHKLNDNGLFTQVVEKRILPDSNIQQPSSQLSRTNPIKKGIRNVMTAGDQHNQVIDHFPISRAVRW